MTRTILTTNFGENKLRHVVRIEGWPSPEEGQDAFKGLMLLMQALVDNPDLMRHASDCPESLRFVYDTHRWVVEATTVVDRPKE
jgi:hypothetical protein